MRKDFSYTGVAQTFVVPTGVAFLRWMLRGGKGGRTWISNVDDHGGGNPGTIQFEVPVVAADSWQVNVGGRGFSGDVAGGGGGVATPGAGGFNGGGNGGTSHNGFSSPGGGGGGTDVRFGGTALSNRVASAAGGGGDAEAYNPGAVSNWGGTGGRAGTGTGVQNGWPGLGPNAGGAGTTAGGAAGSASTGCTAGASGVGGNGANNGVKAGGGGGGGGWFGGGGGGEDNATGFNASGAGGGSNGTVTSTTRGSLANVIHNIEVIEFFGDGEAIAQWAVAPDAPTIDSTLGAGLFNPHLGIAVDAVYSHSDTDLPLNHQTSSLRWRVGVGAWTTIAAFSVDQALPGDVISGTVAANTFSENTIVEIQMESKGIPSGILDPGFSVWSASVFLTMASTPSTPAWVLPTSGSTINTLPFDATWTSVGQTGYQIQQLDASNNVLWDSGEVDVAVKMARISPTARGFSTKLQLRITNGAIWSAWVVLTNITVSATATITPTVHVGLECEVYDELLNFIDYVPSRLTPTFLDELRGLGAGSFTVALNDPIVLRSPDLINVGNIVRVKDDGEYIGFFVIKGHDLTQVGSGESAEEGITARGLGGRGAWFPSAIIYPEKGNADFNIRPNVVPLVRHFGFGSDKSLGHWYDPNLWTTPVAMVAQNITTPMPWSQDNPTTATGNPWHSGPSNWPPAAGAAKWIWWEETRQNESKGVAYFRYEFDLSTQSDRVDYYQFNLSGDDTMAVFLDGVEIATSTSWQDGVQTEILRLTPDKHVLAVAVAQNAPNINASYSGTDPAGFLLAFFKVNSATSGAVQVLYLSDASGTILVNPYPAFAPAWTPGDILKQIIKEARGRGVSGYVNLELGFDQTVDSYGHKWPLSGNQWQFDLGEQYDSVIDKMAQVACEVWFDENLVLQAAPDRGTDRSQTVFFTTYAALLAASDAMYYWMMNNSTFTTDSRNVYDDPDQGVTTVDWFPSSGTGGAAIMFPWDQTHLIHRFNGDWALNQAQFGPSTLHGLKVTGLGLGGGPFNTRTGLKSSTGVLPYTMPTGLVNEPGNGYTMEFVADFGAVTWFTDRGLSGLMGFSGSGSGMAGYGIVNLEVDADDIDGGFVIQRSFLPPDSNSHHIGVVVEHGSSSDTVTVYVDAIETLQQVVSAHDLPTLIDFELNMSIMAAFAYTPRPLSIDELATHRDAAFGVFNANLPVIFNKGKNVLTSSGSLDLVGKTGLLVLSADAVIEVAADSDAITNFGRIEGYYDASSKPLSDAVRNASKTIELVLDTQTSATMEILGGSRPWRDFQVGDWILAPDNYTGLPVPRRVASLSAEEDSANGKTKYTMELDTTDQEEIFKVTKWLSRSVTNGNLSGLIANAG